MKKRSQKKVPSILLPGGAVAGLLILCWQAGGYAGRARARSKFKQEAENRVTALHDPAPPAGNAAPEETVTLESTAALLEKTLQRMREPGGRGTEFLARLEEARVIKDLAKAGTPQLLALADALLDEGGRDAEEMAGRILGPLLTVRNPEDVWAWLRDGAGTGNEVRIRFLSGAESVFSAWAKRDPAAALNTWNREADPLVAAGKLQDNEVGAIFKSWGEANPSEALNTAASLTNPATQKDAAAGVISSLAKRTGNAAELQSADADMLLNRALSLAGDKARPGLESLIKARLHHQSPLEVAAWAGELKTSPEQQVMLNKAIADQWMESGPAAAADWYVSRISPGDAESRAEAMERVIRKWTRLDDHARIRQQARPVDPAAASDWLNAQEPGPHIEGAMAALAQAWGQAGEPEAALAWARALPDGAMRSQSLATVTEEIRQRFPNDWIRLIRP